MPVVRGRAGQVGAREVAAGAAAGRAGCEAGSAPVNVPGVRGHAQKQLAEGMRRVSTVIAAAVIEPGTLEVRRAYEATYGACDRYLRSLGANAQVPGTAGRDELNKQFASITDSAKSLEATVLRQLEELEQLV